jgi:hypothetical protein
MKDPAVLFYTQDFLTGTLLMSYEQKGKYITLLCLQQQNGKLSEKDLMKVCGAKDEDILAKFELHEDGFYYNGRMLLEAEKRKNYCDSRRDIRSTYVKRMENSNKKDEISNKKEEKEIVFKSEVFEFSKKYTEEMLTKFCNYWTETSKSGKMRYEFEKTFEVSKRLATWASRDKTIIKASPEAITYKELVYKFNQGETDMWDKYEPVTPGDKRSLWKLKNK